MQDTRLSNWICFLLHTTGVVLLYFAIVFLLQSMLWREGNYVQNFSPFFLGICYVLALGCIWLLHGREGFLKSLLAWPGLPKKSYRDTRALQKANLRLIHRGTPSLWIVLGIEIPLGLGLLLYEIEALALWLFPAERWQAWIGHFLLAPPEGGLWAWMGLFLSLAVFVPLSEELLFRGWGIGQLARYFPAATLGTAATWGALLWLNALFALFFWNPWQAVVMFPLGLLLSWIRMVSGSLWAVLIVRFVLSLWGLVFEFIGFFGWIRPAPLPQDRLPGFIVLLAFVLTANALWYLYKRRQKLISLQDSGNKPFQGESQP